MAGIFSEDCGETGGATASVARAQPGDLSEGGSEMPMGSEKGLVSMDWFKGKFTGKPHISWENLWFPVKISP